MTPTTLATQTDEQRRQVTLHFAGKGKREVRVGYVTEAPLWKMSYRLLIGGANPANTGKPYLQGWAMVENTSDDDWQNVRLSLVSGRPISFIQDLYQPLYLPRPVVGPDVVASPYPQTHDGSLLSENETRLGTTLTTGRAGASGPSSAAAQSLPDGIQSQLAFSNDGSMLVKFDPARSVQAQAAGQKAGELFQYNIRTPVSCPGDSPPSSRWWRRMSRRTRSLSTTPTPTPAIP